MMVPHRSAHVWSAGWPGVSYNVHPRWSAIFTAMYILMWLANVHPNAPQHEPQCTSQCTSQCESQRALPPDNGEGSTAEDAEECCWRKIKWTESLKRPQRIETRWSSFLSDRKLFSLFGEHERALKRVKSSMRFLRSYVWTMFSKHCLSYEILWNF